MPRMTARRSANFVAVNIVAPIQVALPRRSERVGFNSRRPRNFRYRLGASRRGGPEIQLGINLFAAGLVSAAQGPSQLDGDGGHDNVIDGVPPARSVSY